MDYFKFKNIMDYSSVPVSLLNIDNSYIYLNPALRSLLGYSESSESIDISKIFTDEKLYKFICNSAFSGVSYKGEADLQTNDGLSIPGYLKADPVKDETGSITGIIIFYADISKQRLNEKRLKFLANLQMKLLKPYTLSEKMKDITDTVVTALNAEFARIWLLKPKDMCNKGCFYSSDDIYPVYCMNKDSCLHLTASSGIYTHVTGKHSRIPHGYGNIGMIASGEVDSIVIDNVRGNPAIEDGEWAEKRGLKTFARYKLTDSENSFKGVLSFFSKEEITSDIDFYAESLSLLTSQVIMNSDSEDEIREALDLTERANTLMAGRESRIREMKQEVNRLSLECGKDKLYLDIEQDYTGSVRESDLELKDAVNNALSLAEDAEISRRETAELNEQILRIQQAVNSSSDAIAISTSGGEFFYINRTFTDFFGYSVSELAMCEVNQLFSSKITGRIALNEGSDGKSWKGEAEIVTRENSKTPILLRVDPFKSADGEILGLIWIFTDISERKFAEETIFQYAKAIEKDLEEKKEMLKKARYLQSIFIQNTLPSLKEFNIFTLFMPCEKLGGDFFRIAKGQSENKIVIVIGDCTGHGINASLDASLLANIAESNLSSLFKGNRTDLFLNKVNSEFIKYADEDQFPTMFAAVMDLSTKELFYSNANSELPVRITKNEIKKFEPVKGIHIGYFEESDYGRRKIQLQPGERIVFYSDAVIEIDTEDNRKTGYNWFEKIIAESGGPDISTGEMFDSMIEKIKKENNSFPLKDDTTLIIMEYVSDESKNYNYNIYSDCSEMYEGVKKRLKYLDYTAADINQISIALEEICLNAFNHGNKNDPEKSVEINTEINCSFASFSITDQGEGFNPGDIPDPTINLEKLLDEDIEENYTHGRGVWISKQYMDSVIFNEKGNSVQLIKSKKNTVLRAQ